jgi:hypothetical protein
MYSYPTLRNNQFAKAAKEVLYGSNGLPSVTEKSRKVIVTTVELEEPEQPNPEPDETELVPSVNITPDLLNPVEPDFSRYRIPHKYMN